ncbi:N-acetyltransferase [Glycomyces sp. NPDC047010]|uniref:N-acetyltransferase n=1 Tax=Glycomyces sp. NPDC047010 TaxID=3155023 RepID=UPI0034105852
MPFTTMDSGAPAGFATDDFLLRPIRAADAELDYAAVMESRDYLLGWEQTGWPAEDFTVEANREDLEKLERWHEDGAGFTYTVMDPAETECLGCVYLRSTTARAYAGARITPVGDHRWDAYEATVSFWVRRSRLGTPTDTGLLARLRTWLARDWSLRGHLFTTSELFTQQVDLIGRTDLRHRFTIEKPDTPGRYLAYE